MAQCILNNFKNYVLYINKLYSKRSVYYLLEISSEIDLLQLKLYIVYASVCIHTQLHCIYVKKRMIYYNLAEKQFEWLC